MPTFYRFARGIFLLWAKMTGIKFIGQENVPAEGGKYVYCANHTCFWDPFMLAVAVPSFMHFMAKNTFYNNAVLRFLLKRLQVIALHRGEADLIALKTALAYLKKDEALAIFPEGTRVRTGKLGDFKSGGVFIAMRGGAQIVPCAIINSQDMFRFWKKNRTVIIGKPYLPQKAEAAGTEEPAAKLKREIQDLLAEYSDNRQ